MPIKLANRIINLIWYSTAILIVLAAIIVSIGRELMPQVNLDSERLTQQAEKRIGAKISFTNLRGRWVRLFPEFTADAVEIRNNNLQLRMEKVDLDIDVVRSILQRSPVFDRLELADAHISFKQEKSSTAPDLEKTWRTLYLLLNRNIWIRNVDLDIQTDTASHQIHIADFRVEQKFMEKQLFIRLKGNTDEQFLTITGTLSGESLVNSDVKLYIKTANWPIQEWLPQTDEHTAPVLQKLLVADWQTSGEVWIGWQGTELISGITRLQLHHDNVKPQENQHGETQPPGILPAGNDSTVFPDTLDTTTSFKWQRGVNTLLHIEALQLKKQEATINLLQKAIIDFRDTAHWQLQAKTLPLENVAPLAEYLPDGLLKELLTTLHPSGELTNVDLQWDGSKPMDARMLLRANPSNISSGAWHGVPAFTHINGYLETGIHYGFLDLDSQDGFSMFYPAIYHEPMLFQKAAGRVQWNWLPQEKVVLVGSDHARLVSDAGVADGNFWLYLPLAGSDRQAEMNLAIGLRDSRASQRDKFLPYTLPANLLAWLKDSIGEADIRDAGFIYRGLLTGHENLSRAIQFYANFDNGDLQFEKDWPRLTNLQGKVLVDDDYVAVRTQKGQIYNTALEPSMVNVYGGSAGMTITVNGRARGYAEDGLRILRETPLRKTLGNAFDNWRIPSGLIAAGIQLKIPLGSDKLSQQEDVRIDLFDTQLQMNDLRLQLDAIQGSVVYQTDKGLTATGLKASLFQKPVTFNIDSKKTADALTVNISGNGKARCNDIAQWARLRPLQMLNGDFDYKAGLTLGPFGKTPRERIGELQINSDMQQTSLALPPPFAKIAGEKSPMKLTVGIFQGNRQDYSIEYNKQLSGALSMRNGQLFSGLILFGDNLSAGKTTYTPQTSAPPEKSGPLRIQGKLPDGDLQQWIDVVSTFNKLPQLQEGTSDIYPEFSFRMDNASWRDLTFPAISTDIVHGANAWNVRFDSTNANGYINFYDTAPTGQIPVPDLVFDSLKIYHTPKADATETSGTDKSPLTNINFAEVPSTNIRINHLFFNDMDIGNISTQLVSSSNALQFSKLQMTGPGFAVRGKDSDAEAEMIWRRNADGIYQSEFHGMLHMQGEQPALKHLGVDPFVRGENIYLASDLLWTGSPLDFAMPTLYGRVQTHGQKGKYLQASPNTAMQAISVVNIANWARRLRLDFSDLASDGISFNEFRGELSFNNGDMEFSQPLTVQSPSSSMVLSGVSHLNTGLLDLRLTATLPVSSNATWITALAGGLPAAAGVYLVSKIFGDQIEKITSLTYSITGPSAEPDIRFERIAAPREKPVTQ